MQGYWKLVIGALALAGISAAVSQAPTSIAPVVSPASPVTQGLPIAPAPTGSATLTKTDLEAWLDGYMPFALARGDIAGGVVVVVKDGQVLLQKGYGYSDVAKRTPVSADGTMFRPGSVSKLFTWTAVMQLVEEGKLDLDKDVNTYLDFKIPAYDGKPITLRNILTHTAGFEESARYTISAKPMDLGKLMTDALPKRVFAPGGTPAYSNYATALAGHIVARQSGMSFDDYIDSKILSPIGMTRSTFRQPLPANLKPLMSKGYALGSEKPKDFEFVGPAPAGSLSATGADMAKFMIAHLNQGQGLLKPETAAQMHTPQMAIVPPLNRMALGFYEQNFNDRRSIGHAGDTQYFHSDMSLYLDDGVGIFVSVNSGGKEGASGPLRSALFDEFANRYFPTSLGTAKVDSATAKKHAEMMAGTYENSRGFHSTFLNILSLLGPVKMAVGEDGSLLAPSVADLAGQPRKWVEIAPFVWRDSFSGKRLAAKVVDGKVVRWSFDQVSPFMVFDRVPWYKDAAWLAPLFFASFGIIALTAVGWPAGAIARRRYGQTLAFTGRRLQVHRWTKILAWASLAVFVAWIALIFIGLEDLEFLGGAFTGPLIILQILSPIVFVGFVGFAAWTLRYVWREGKWTAKLWAALVLCAALVVLWVALSHNLIGFGLKF